MLASRAAPRVTVTSARALSARPPLLAQRLHGPVVLERALLQLAVGRLLAPPPLGGRGRVGCVERPALSRHAVGDLGEDRVGLDELRREELVAPRVVRRLGLATLGFRPAAVERGLAQLDGQEEGEEVADAKAAAARPDGPSAVGAVGALRAHALDELEEGRLPAGRALQHDAGEDLHEHVLALHVDEDLVAHDAQVARLVQLVAHQPPQVDEAAARDHAAHHRALRAPRRAVRLRVRTERRVDARVVRVEVHRAGGVAQPRTHERGDDLVGLLRREAVRARAEQLALARAALLEEPPLEEAVVRARDVEEAHALACDGAVVVGALHVLRQGRHTTRHVLDALAELLEVPVHVADGAERVVRGQEDLAAVDEGAVRVGGEQLGRVAHHRALDLRLARRDDARVEVDLGGEAERLLEGLQEAEARGDVAHPVVAVGGQHAALELGRHGREPGQREVAAALVGRAAPLNEADDCAWVGLALPLLPRVVGEHVEHAHAVGVLAGLGEQQLRVQRAVALQHAVEVAVRHLEAEHRHTLLSTVVGGESLEVIGGEVVEGGDGGVTLCPLGLNRPVGGGGVGCGGEGDWVGVDGSGGEGGGRDGSCLARRAARFEVAIGPQKAEFATSHLARTKLILLVHHLLHLLARDHKLDASRVGRREQQRACPQPTVLRSNAPSKSVEKLLHQVAAVHLEGFRVRSTAHLAPCLPRSGNILSGVWLELGEGCEPLLDGLIVREWLKSVDIEL
mmetsp:Transcript_2595/g.6461  ORF Transcript_2595/g.6461 Transcript_2595/m.6461 type:complete len:740 (-) Transcript_2595:139-2358(-)